MQRDRSFRRSLIAAITILIAVSTGVRACAIWSDRRPHGLFSTQRVLDLAEPVCRTILPRFGQI